MEKKRKFLRGFQLNLECPDSFRTPIIANVQMAIADYLFDSPRFNNLPPKLQNAVTAGIIKYCKLQQDGWVQEIFSAVRETARQNKVDLDQQYESLNFIAPKLDETLESKLAEFMDEAITVAGDRVAYMLAQYKDPRNAAKFGLN